MHVRGVPFHGDFSSADASGLNETASRISLYVAGATTAITLAATDRVIVTDIFVAGATNGIFTTLYDGADATVDAGEKIAVINTSAGSAGKDWTPRVPHWCQAGTYPKVKTTGAAQTDVTIRGYIRS